MAGTTQDAYFQQPSACVPHVFLLTAEGEFSTRPMRHSCEGSYEKGFGLSPGDRSVKQRPIGSGDLWRLNRMRGLAKESRDWAPALRVVRERSVRGPRCADQNRCSWRGLRLLIRDGDGLARVNWRDMGPEEPEARSLSNCYQTDNRAQKGNARKTTGSYYTPDSLVQVLLDSALEPVVQATIAAHPKDAGDALLNLSIVDPAAGSGHFLLAAARRLAAHVARLQVEGTPSAAEYRHALRQE
jgi:hypothetical protein